MRRMMAWAAATGMVMTAGSAAAQTTDQRQANARRVEELQQAIRLKESRYQIGQMERVLEGAVEHGATVIRDQLQAAMPADMLLTENARARGFRLEGYGVFFDVEVPSLSGTLPWSFWTLNQNNLGLDNALQTLRSFVDASAGNDVNLQQALKRIELQMAPAAGPALSVANTANGSAAPGPVETLNPQPTREMLNGLNNINEAYRSEIREALIDAMLEHSRGLGIPATESLTVAARSSDDRPRLAPADSELRTVIISIRGSDLAMFLAGQISREEARTRVDIRVF